MPGLLKTVIIYKKVLNGMIFTSIIINRDYEKNNEIYGPE